MLTPLEYSLIFLVSLVVVIYGVNVLVQLYSKRERGELPRKQKRIKKK